VNFLNDKYEDIIVLVHGTPKPLLVIDTLIMHSVSSRSMGAKSIQTNCGQAAIITTMFSSSDNLWPPHTKIFRNFALFEMKRKRLFQLIFKGTPQRSQIFG